MEQNITNTHLTTCNRMIEELITSGDTNAKYIDELFALQQAINKDVSSRFRRRHRRKRSNSTNAVDVMRNVRVFPGATTNNLNPRYPKNVSS